MATLGSTRRAFLTTVIAAAAGLVGCWRYLTPARGLDPRALAVPLADVPRGGALVLPEDGIAVTQLRDGEVRVLDLTCTHLGCRVAATETGFTCPCHGSRFDERGGVLTGPAPRPLHTLAYREREGILMVDRPESS